MKFEAISLKYKNAIKKIPPRLTGRVFHITSPENFMLITKCGEIRNNKDEIFPKNWQYDSYFSLQGCISVCDLANNTKPRVTREKYLSDYQIFNQNWGSTTVFLFLSPKIHDKLITWDSWRKLKTIKPKIVPELESGYPNAIPLAEIEEIWFITIEPLISKTITQKINKIYKKFD